MGSVDEVVYLLEEAFQGVGIEDTNESQSLLGNLSTVDGAAWRALPVGGARTIESIVLHVGSCKIMYDDHAFGPATRRWDDPDLVPWTRGDAPLDDAIAWVSAAHAELLRHVRSLSDADLALPRLTNWGERRETRWLLSALLQHDLYHAGEINHLRALVMSDDGWMWG